MLNHHNWKRHKRDRNRSAIRSVTHDCRSYDKAMRLLSQKRSERTLSRYDENGIGINPVRLYDAMMRDCSYAGTLGIQDYALEVLPQFPISRFRSYADLRAAIAWDIYFEHESHPYRHDPCRYESDNQAWPTVGDAFWMSYSGNRI
jgi:hypothetical protein